VPHLPIGLSASSQTESAEEEKRPDSPDGNPETNVLAVTTEICPSILPDMLMFLALNKFETKIFDKITHSTEQSAHSSENYDFAQIDPSPPAGSLWAQDAELVRLLAASEAPDCQDQEM
jgi:hypothetical protein